MLQHNLLGLSPQPCYPSGGVLSILYWHPGAALLYLTSGRLKDGSKANA